MESWKFMQILSTDIVKIQSKGLLTIPKKIRQNLGFEENSLVRVIEEKGRVVIEPIRTLPYPVRIYTRDEINEFLELDKKETKTLRRKGLL